MSIKPGGPQVILPTIPSVDTHESDNTSHRSLAPLASSETFSDLAASARDDQPSEETSPSTLKVKSTTKNDFDSLEVLFDFSSSGISSDMQLETESTSPTPNRRRSSQINTIMSIEKV